MLYHVVLGVLRSKERQGSFFEEGTCTVDFLQMLQFFSEQLATQPASSAASGAASGAASASSQGTIIHDGLHQDGGRARD